MHTHTAYCFDCLPLLIRTMSKIVEQLLTVLLISIKPLEDWNNIILIILDAPITVLYTDAR